MTKPSRRPRYRGTHPRAFHEKYKELQPARYADETLKVQASGKTPAGTHRPIMVAEVLEVLAPKPGEFAVDTTLGYGGHARVLLDAVAPGGRLLGLDVDPIELAKTAARLGQDVAPDRLSIRRSNFAGLVRILGSDGLPPADIVLADLGVSSMQIDDPSRGFTFKRTGPLDLRMNPQRGQPASALLGSLGAPALARLLDVNADEPDAVILAEAIAAGQRRVPIETTTALAETIVDALRGIRPARDADSIESSVRRVFQALRIEVNDELGALDAFLRFLPECLAPGGRVAILAFHSGEDRRVKQAFKEGVRTGVYRDAADLPIRASPGERHSNPRSSSAKLRWAIRA